jgi:hypothetical protein
MSASVRYESIDSARLAASSALTVDMPANPDSQSADLSPQDPEAESRAKESVQSALEEIKREWGEESAG